MKKFFVHDHCCLLAIFLFIITLMFSSCSKEDFNFDKSSLDNWHPMYAFPITTKTLDINDVMKLDSMEELVQDSNHMLTLIYRSDLKKIEMGSMISLPDQQFDKSAQFNIDPDFQQGDSVLLPFTLNAALTIPGNVLIKDIYLKGGTMKIHLNTDINYTGRIQMNIPTATKNGQPLVQTLYYAGTSIDFTLDLSEYRFSVSNLNGQNSVDVFFKLFMYNNGSPNLSPYHVDASMSLKNLAFSKVTGYFGKNTYIHKDSIDIGLYRNKLNGKLSFEDPKVKITMNTSFGLPIQIDFKQVRFYQPTANPNHIDLSGFPNPINLPVPPTNEPIGYVIKFDRNNSNLRDGINILPRAMKYEIDFTSNPYGNRSLNTVYDNSSFSAEAQLELPFFGEASDFSLQDTAAFTFSSLPSKIDSVRFKSIAINGFPFDAKMQVYFLNSGGTIIDSLATDNSNVVGSGVVDEISGKVTAPGTKIHYFGKSKTQMDKLKACKKLIVKAWLSSTNKGVLPVKVYAEDSLEIRLSAEARATLEK